MLYAMYQCYMQCTNVICNVPMLYAIYECYMQCTNVICNLRMLHAIYECYMQCTNFICNLRMLYAIYECYMQSTNVICNVWMLEAMSLWMSTECLFLLGGPCVVWCFIVSVYVWVPCVGLLWFVPVLRLVSLCLCMCDCWVLICFGFLLGSRLLVANQCGLFPLTSFVGR